MSNDRDVFDRDALRDTDAPGELLRRYLAAGGSQALAYVLLGAGALLLIVGWFGVSREVIVSKQIPYLVSGGLGGAFLLGLGALLMVTHELRLDNRRLTAVEMLMEELRDALLLDDGAPAAGAATAATPAPAAAATNGNGSSHKKFAVVAGGSRYHRDTCSAAAGKELTYVAGESLQKQGLQPCRLCAPEMA